jgi:hypothetical protein
MVSGFRRTAAFGRGGLAAAMDRLASYRRGSGSRGEGLLPIGTRRRNPLRASCPDLVFWILDRAATHCCMCGAVQSPVATSRDRVLVQGAAGEIREPRACRLGGESFSFF